MHRAVSIARELVAIPSVNPMGKNVTGEIYSEKNVASYISSFLKAINIDCEISHTDPNHPNVIGKLNVGAQETVLLEAHMDTVSHENMSIDPFDPQIRDGQLYGRGSCDTKASIAVYLSAIEEILKRGISLKRNLLFAFVHNEEYSFGGAKEFIKQEPRAKFAITGEPTSLDIIYAHKGICRFTLTTRGKSAHSALPWLGDSAIYKMSHVLANLQSYADDLQKVTHPHLGTATINVGRIWGGETVNTVPSSCTIEIDHRLLPDDSYKSIREHIEEKLHSLNGFDISLPFLDADGVYNDPNSIPCIELVEACQAANWKPKLKTAHYGTDASIYSRIGIPTIVFGPGDVQLAHTAAECVPIAEIEKAHEVIIHLLRNEVSIA